MGRKQTVVKLAFEGAKACLDDKTLNIKDVADKLEVTRHLVGKVKLILEFGTSEEIVKAQEGGNNLNNLVTIIRNRLTDKQKYELRTRNGVWSERRRASLKTDADLWAKFGSALKTLAELPLPTDVLAVVKANTGRTNTVKQYQSGIKWMEDFANEWTAFNNGKNLVDSGRGGKTS